ncbi:MmgE/PrpD family protein [Starkeya sp. ORNL1]|uniref:MmgE/PrpD family protein n=1 Tax=Starkeya sp. ORNL1 TaxID=2709380 RepID=UPI001463D5C1|nr:MmgE/PrpD family protein [Starkeya sp. ORNL1]QJP14433.1 MmgE/PrpD family protein [Starkeya sp. ORNL1]
MDKVLDQISDYAVSLNYKDFSAETVHEIVKRVVDTFGCAMGSYPMEPPRIARAHALEVTSTPGATLLGTRHKTSPELASFANGVMARYSDFNDMAVGKKAGHPSDVILPILAAAEYVGGSIQDAMAGMVLAYELQDRMGDSCVGVLDGGWDYVIYTAVATAAGAGRAMGLDKEQIANAMAIAVTSNVATHQTRRGELSMWKGCAAPNAARNGVFAAMLARRGLTGPDEAFEGITGFNNQLRVKLELPVLGGRNGQFTIEQSRFKNYPCDYEAQCCVTPAMELHQILGGTSDNVAKVEIVTYTHAVECSADSREKWNPTSRETADHSLPYCVAVALANGTIWVDDFLEERISDPKIHALMQKIEVRATEELDKTWPEAYPFIVTVTTNAGEQHTREIHYAKGHPKNPMNDQEIATKFRKLSESVLGSEGVDKALDVLWRIESLPKISDVFEPFVLDASNPAARS